ASGISVAPLGTRRFPVTRVLASQRVARSAADFFLYLPPPMPAPALRARCRATDKSVAVAKRRELAALQNACRRIYDSVEQVKTCGTGASPHRCRRVFLWMKKSVPSSPAHYGKSVYPPKTPVIRG
ncbi:MAG: hypothetical protein LBV28_01905, partial [Puniceicoccales bacterium]|nr:hypothetical protein [Puniceicoccales bacterium]